MRRLANLYRTLHQTTRTHEKVAALQSYFSAAPPEDAAWALHFLIGRKSPRLASSPLLRQWIEQETRYPAWLVDECCAAAGDLGETLALLLPESGGGPDLPLHLLVRQRLLQTRQLPEECRREILLRTWRELDGGRRLVFNKLITGSFCVGVARTWVVRALAALAGLPPAVIEHRLMTAWTPTAENFRHLVRPGEGAVELAQPYPFFLASPLPAPDSLGSLEDWLVEWKWDGLRAQIIRRRGQVLLWSRGEEFVSQTFPEIVAAARALNDGVVLDGQILAWRDEQPLSFGVLQRRMGRKAADAKVRAASPVAYMAFDLLELGATDLRSLPLRQRREKLETILSALSPALPLRISPLLRPQTWAEAAELQNQSRARRVGGLMFKRWSSPYGVGRPPGVWWKWKINPHLVDAVLIYAEPGHGHRPGLFTDYTFGVWHQGQLVPIAKSHSGLSDAEMEEVDAFVRRNTVGKFGPVRVVKPEAVFELAFEGLRESPRRRSGVALHFPRIIRWRRDKKPAEAAALESLRKLL